MEQEKRVKIIGLQIENVRRFKAGEMEFAENGLIQFRGQNEQGKTTILDCLEIIFNGDKSKTPDIVKHGEEKAKISLDLGDYQVEKVFDNEKSRLVITEKSTKQPIKNPQAFLNEMVNTISFNPFKFLNLTPLEKNRFLMKLYKIDFTEINKKLEKLEQERKTTGRDIDKIGIPTIVNPAYKESSITLFEEKKTIEDENRWLKINYEKLLEDERSKAVDYNNALKAYNNSLFEKNNKITSLKDEKAENLKRIQELLAKNSTIANSVKALEEEVATLEQPKEVIVTQIEEPEYKNTSSIDEKIKNCELNNENAIKYNAYIEKRNERLKLEEEYKSFDSKIDDLRNEKLKILAETPTKIEGLVITEESVILNGINSENWSDAQGIETACKLCIVQNPQLRAIFIDKGESFDKKRLKTLEKWAIENDIQAFITIVDEIPESLQDGVFYIEEGKIITKIKE